jgi:dimethylargininase
VLDGAGPKARAFTRPVPDSINRCELTHVRRVEIDVARARVQHAAYEQALTDIGCAVQSLPVAHDMPDSVFVEDTAVILAEIAVIARPGAPSRQQETEAVAATLAAYRRLAVISAPGTLDGGDVMSVGPGVYVGVSGRRTNAAGVRQLAEIVEPCGYRVYPIETHGCLHLKTAVSALGPDLLLVNPDWVDAAQFAGMKAIAIDPDEPFAANVVQVGNAVLCATSSPKTGARLQQFGLEVTLVDLSELTKAEAALTCCSLILRG